jgi:secreted trypsin-like serine protease
LSISNEPGSSIYSVWQIINHPDWSFSSSSFDADISLVVIKDPINFRFVTKVGIICLPQQTSNELQGYGTIVGWGKSEQSEANGKDIDSTPNQLDLPIVSNELCQKTNESFAISISNRTFCAGFVNKTKSACVGDSGTGFYLRDEALKSYNLVGIVSASLEDPDNKNRRCNVETYTIYTNVAKFSDWIAAKMKETAEISWKKVAFDCSEVFFR